MKLYIVQISPYPITFSPNSLRTDQHCCQTQSTVFPECHRPKVTPTFMKIPHKLMHICLYLNSSVFRKEEGQQKFWGCSRNYSRLISSQFLDSANFIPQHNFKIIQVPQPSKISNNVSARSSFFKGWYPHCPSTIHSKSRTVACQCTNSL